MACLFRALRAQRGLLLGLLELLELLELLGLVALLLMRAGRDSRAMRRRWDLLVGRRCSSSSYSKLMMDDWRWRLRRGR